jgi:MFS family permease
VRAAGAGGEGTPAIACEDGPMRSSETTRLLRRPGYARYFTVVALVRAVGTMFTVSGVLLLLERTGNLSLAGLVVASATLPAAITGPVLGAWLDVTTSRRRLIVLDRTLTFFALGALLLLAGHAPDWTLPFVGLAYGATSPLSGGAFTAMLPEVAGEELIDVAYTFEATSINVAFILGPALAGALVALAGAATAVEVQLGAGAVLTVLIALDRTYDLRPAAVSPHERIRDAVREGLTALWRIRTLRANTLTFAIYVTGFGSLVVGFPVYALSVGAHASAAGYLWAAFALGSMISAFALRLPALRVPPHLLVMGSFALMAASALAWPLAGSLAAALVLVMVTGVLEGPSFVALLAVRQRVAPAHLRGQIFSTEQSLSLAASAIGEAAAGPFHAQFGTTATLGAFAALLLAAAAAALGMRHAETETIASDPAVGREETTLGVR